MGVVRTDKWLRIYSDQWDESYTLKDRSKLQRQVMIKPLCDVFNVEDLNSLQHYLLQIGLSGPDLLGFDLKKWIAHDHWSLVQRQFIFLQQRWKGPDVKIYLLPIEERNSLLMKQLRGKMGITLPHAIILFITNDIKKNELFALVTHEYHHTCRLNNTKVSEETITLLESIIMEGLAEFAVKEELGPDVNAIWTKYYDENWQNEWFKKWIKPNMNVKGRKNHYPYLYGEKRSGIPLWLGYYTGYRIVSSAANDNESTLDLLNIDSKTLFERTNIFEE